MTDAVKQTPRDPFDLPDVSDLSIGVLGGTGEQGRGLALRWAQAGHTVVIGSRDAQRAAASAAELGHGVTGAANAECAAGTDVVVAAVPWAGHAELLSSLAEPLRGKILIDCVNPLGFDKAGAYALPVEQGSAAQQAAELLPRSRVVAAFHHISAVLLLDPAITTLDTDVLVLGDDRDALVRAGQETGGQHAGRLARGLDDVPEREAMLDEPGGVHADLPFADAAAEHVDFGDPFDGHQVRRGSEGCTRVVSATPVRSKPSPRT